MSNTLPQVAPKFNYVSQKLMRRLNEGVYSHYHTNTLGKILTIIDASVADIEQRKAVKDLIRSVFYQSHYLDETGIRHVCGSLSRFLFNKFRTTVSEEDVKLWEEYQKLEMLEAHSDELEEDLKKAEIG